MTVSINVEFTLNFENASNSISQLFIDCDRITHFAFNEEDAINL